jgi:hypothetical protein
MERTLTLVTLDMMYRGTLDLDPKDILAPALVPTDNSRNTPLLAILDMATVSNRNNLLVRILGLRPPGNLAQ